MSRPTADAYKNQRTLGGLTRVERDRSRRPYKNQRAMPVLGSIQPRAEWGGCVIAAVALIFARKVGRAARRTLIFLRRAAATTVAMWHQCDAVGRDGLCPAEFCKKFRA